MKRHNRPYPLYDHPKFDTLRELALRHAQERPEQTAFAYRADKGQTVEKSYRVFREEVDALGTYLMMQGYRNARIAIVGENSYEWLLAFVTAASGGNVAVTLDKELPAGKIGGMAEFAGCKAVVYSAQYADKVESLHADIARLPMDEFPEYIARGRKAAAEGERGFLDYRPDPDAPAAVFFTSGTTGEGKGVALSNRNLCFDIRSSCRNASFSGPNVSVLPYHHSFGLAVVFVIFLYGYPVYINRSLKRLLPDMAAVKPQNMFLVPLFVENFHRQIWEGARRQGKEKLMRRMMKVCDALGLGAGMRRKLFSSVHEAFGGRLECIVSGGAALDEKYVEEFRCWGFQILNGYGITECSPVVSVNRNGYWRDGSVGQVVPGCEVRIAEDGEVLVKGGNVMLGYLNDEEATREAVKDGWYATGDLGYLDGDGFLFLTGRKKNLIILSNGENVSPEELEKEILRDGAVAEAVVYGENHGLAVQIYPQEEFLGKQEYFEGLVQKVNRKMPAYKRISRVVLRDREFEKSTTKKILRYKVTQK